MPGPGETVSPNDPALDAGWVDFPFERDRVIAYRARPRGRGPFPTILLLPDNRGLSQPIQQMARRLAKGGYLALAPDYLWRTGGTDAAGDLTAVTTLLSRLAPERIAQDVGAAVRYLEGLDFVAKSALGVFGLDLGATVAWIAAADFPQLKANVVVGGDPPSASRLQRIKGEVLGIYAEYDRRQMDALPPLEEAARRAGVRFTSVIIKGVERGFLNEANIEYQERGAREAWERAMAFFEMQLRAEPAKG
ncbi:MAG: hypothetical protein KatS3mg061_2213 [Dehalococcoidia bacterium]|nr:MAG: hypothetical protein KatS3mg061_2213 [Dehalococcoidia bacterium]